MRWNVRRSLAAPDGIALRIPKSHTCGSSKQFGPELLQGLGLSAISHRGRATLRDHFHIGGRRTFGHYSVN